MQPSPKQTILIADDHEIVRIGLKFTISTADDFEVIGEASNGLDALEKVRLLRPDIILADIVMPEIDGFELAHILANESVPPKIVLITAVEEFIDLKKVLRCRCDGFIFKTSTCNDILFTLREISRGMNVFPKAFFSMLKLPYFSWYYQNVNGLFSFTHLQREIIFNKIIGKKEKNIAEELKVPVNEVFEVINSYAIF